MDLSTILYWSFFAINWLIFFFEQYLLWRQYQVHLKMKKRPPSLSKLMTESNYESARCYEINKDYYNFVTGILNQSLITIFVFGGGITWIWDCCGKVSSNELLHSNYFFFIFIVAENVFKIPPDFYKIFVIEHKHGFNQQTIQFFLNDKAKKIVFDLLLTLPVLTGIIYVVRNGGEYFFVYLWLFISAITFIMMSIYPDFIAPRFDSFIPLPDGKLKANIEALAKNVGFHLTQIFIVQGSKRSSHSNAYFYGFWNNKRIVIFDTLFHDPEESNHADGIDSKECSDAKTDPMKESKKGLTDEEIVAIIGHELGHWKLGHNVIQICISEINLFFTLFVFGYFHSNSALFEAFGFQKEHPIIIGFLLLSFLGVFNKITGIAQTFATRYMEFAADRFSANLGLAESLANSLAKLGNDNLAFPINDPLYLAIYHSHPSVLERINILQNFCGSRAYVAHEIMCAKAYRGNGVDIWSSGIILYIMINGVMPFDDRDSKMLIQRQKSQMIQFSRKCSKPARDLILQMLQPNPFRRATIPTILSSQWLEGTRYFMRGLVEEESTCSTASLIPDEYLH